MAYWKTNAPAVMAAWIKERDSVAALRAAADKFAARYGGTGHLYSDPARFAGVKFTTEKPRDLWRAPDSHGLQCPRSKPFTGASAEIRAELKALNSDWAEHVPKDRIDSDELYGALGVQRGDFFFTGLSMFQHAGWVYAETGTHMERMTEILGSEFVAADTARRRAKKPAGEGATP